jgi:hypothetical protein
MRGNSEPLGDPPGRPIGAADIANQALRHEIVERAERFLLRCQRIRHVDLTEIDSLLTLVAMMTSERLTPIAFRERLSIYSDSPLE